MSTLIYSVATMQNLVLGSLNIEHNVLSGHSGIYISMLEISLSQIKEHRMKQQLECSASLELGLKHSSLDSVGITLVRAMY